MEHESALIQAIYACLVEANEAGAQEVVLHVSDLISRNNVLDGKLVVFAPFAMRPRQKAKNSPLTGEGDLYELGKSLREYRNALGISRSEAARRALISITYLYHLENAVRRTHGEPSQPAKNVLERIAEVLKLTQEERQRLLVLAGYQ